MGEYKFQSLTVYQLSLDYLDLVERLPDNERFNLCSQIARAATSITLNIAEGSTGQSNKEQTRFLGMAIRSYIETVACLDLIDRRGYIPLNDLSRVKRSGRTLFYKITKFKKALKYSDPPRPVSLLRSRLQPLLLQDPVLSAVKLFRSLSPGRVRSAPRSPYAGRERSSLMAALSLPDPLHRERPSILALHNQNPQSRPGGV